MKFIAFCTLLFFGLALGQTNRFFYLLSYKIDSLQKDYYKDYFVLDINSNNTKFYKKNLYDADSLNRQFNENLKITLPVGHFFLVKNNNNEDFNENYGFVDNKYYVFKTIDKIRWSLTTETKTIENYTLQKAITNFGGRSWTAWFCNEIPYNSGPYKFRGLPGLIFEIYDSEKNYVFFLVKNITAKKTVNTDNFLETNFGEKPIIITFQQYKNIAKTSYNNLFQELKDLDEGSWIMKTKEGEEISTKIDLKKQIIFRQKMMKNNNNPIDLRLLIDY